MGLFDGYVQLSNETGIACMSVSSSGITFSKVVVTKLKYPAYITLWINKEKKMLLITPSEEKESEYSFKFSKEDAACGPLIHRKNVKRTILEMMDLNAEQLTDTYYVDGEFYPDENAFQFDTKKAYTK